MACRTALAGKEKAPAACPPSSCHIAPPHLEAGPPPDWRSCPGCLQGRACFCLFLYLFLALASWSRRTNLSAPQPAPYVVEAAFGGAGCLQWRPRLPSVAPLCSFWCFQPSRLLLPSGQPTRPPRTPCLLVVEHPAVRAATPGLFSGGCLGWRRLPSVAPAAAFSGAGCFFVFLVVFSPPASWSLRSNLPAHHARPTSWSLCSNLPAPPPLPLFSWLPSVAPAALSGAPRLP